MRPLLTTHFKYWIRQKESVDRRAKFFPCSLDVYSSCQHLQKLLGYDPCTVSRENSVTHVRRTDERGHS